MNDKTFWEPQAIYREKLRSSESANYAEKIKRALKKCAIVKPLKPEKEQKYTLFKKWKEI